MSLAALGTQLEPNHQDYAMTYERQYYGYTAKQVKQLSIVLLLGLIEGRNDTTIHKSITQGELTAPSATIDPDLYKY
jgi:hypothetical protein